MRLIDADVLIKQCKPRGISDEVWKESNEYKQIINAPTIDAVKVVRCKDCIFYEKALSVQGFCHAHGSIVHANAFCSYGSYGEHRENGEE